MSENNTSFIVLKGITRTYTKGDVSFSPLADVDLEIDRGTFFVLLGPSGSGKTTLLNLLAGIDRPSRGQIVIGGTDTTACSRRRLTTWRAAHVGYVFQQANLVPVLTAYENVELPLFLWGLTRQQRAERVGLALEAVGLRDRAAFYPRQLSGGQEQRVAIARAIVADPPILLADEPTGNLDQESADAILRLLDRLNQEMGKTIVMVTHDSNAAAHATRAMCLVRGALVPIERSEGAST